MTKIAIISCVIVAVCVFQTAGAGIFDASGLDSILGGVKSGVTDALGNVKKMEQEVENRGKGLLSDMQNKLNSSKSQLQTSTGCTNVYSEAQQMISNLIAAFQTCISNQTQAHSADIQRLSNAVNNLTSVLGKNFQDAASCFHLLVTPWDITKISQCFSTIPQDVIKVPPIIGEGVLAASKLVQIFPDVGICFQKAVIQSVASNAAKLVKDVQQCFTSALQPFNQPFKL